MASVQLPLPDNVLPKLLVGFGVIRIDLERPFVMGNGFRQLALVGQGVGQIVLGFSIIRD